MPVILWLLGVPLAIVVMLIVIALTGLQFRFIERKVSY